LVPLETQLVSGDTVEIFTSKGGDARGPSRDWLDMVATHRAGNKIRQWFSRERREDMVAQGRDDVIKAIRREGLPVQRITKGPLLADLADELNYADIEALYAAVGERHVSAKSVAARAAKALRGGEDGSEEQIPTTARSPRKGRRTRASTRGVHVEGLDDLLVRLSKCCTPVPGDEIIGFVTRGRGVSVHRADCANAVSLSDGQADRVIDVEWDDDSEGTFVASIEVKALDRSGLLGDVTTTLTDHHVNIVASNTATGGDRVSTMRFEFELGDPSHLDSLIASIKGIESVYDAYRVVPGKGG
jgi:GTP pyrophosphokinase